MNRKLTGQVEREFSNVWCGEGESERESESLLLWWCTAGRGVVITLPATYSSPQAGLATHRGVEAVFLAPEKPEKNKGKFHARTLFAAY